MREDDAATWTSLAAFIRRPLSRRSLTQALAVLATKLGSPFSPNFDDHSHVRHTANDAISGSTVDPILDVKAFGAVGDGRADDTAAIGRALAAANRSATSGIGAGNGGMVMMPPGIYLVRQTTSVPPQTRLVGSGRNATTLRAASGFDFASGGRGSVVRVNGFGSRVEHLSIDCSDLDESVGLYSDSINEQSGAFHVQVFGFRKLGIWISNEPPGRLVAQTYTLEDLELTYSPNAVPGVTGLLIEGRFASPRWVRGVTVNCMRLGTRVPGSVGLSFQAAVIQGEGLHVENVETGILLGTSRSCSGSDLAGVSAGPNVSTALRIGAPDGVMNSYTIRNVIAVGEISNLIDDLARSFRHSGRFLTFYAVGGSNSPATITVDDELRVHGVNVLGPAAYKLQGQQVIGARDTGWTRSLGTANKGAFETSKASVADCAQRIKAIEDALRSHGLIG